MTKIATQGVVNKNIQQQVDSLARLAIDEQAERLLNSLEEKQTTLIFFDTDKSPDDSSGLPPIKAIAHQEVKREEQKIEKQQNQVQSEIELKEETATIVEVEEKASWWDILKQHIMYILLIPVLIIALWATYKIIKILK